MVGERRAIRNDRSLSREAAFLCEPTGGASGAPSYQGSGIVKIAHTPAEVRFWHISCSEGLSQTVQFVSNTSYSDRQGPYLYGTLQAMLFDAQPIHTKARES